MRRISTALAVSAVLAVTGCGDGARDSMRSMMGPSSVTPQMPTAPQGPAFMSISPAGGATGVPTSATITIRFGATMALTAGQYVDLHVGSLAGPSVTVGCGWSGDLTTLTCTPTTPLERNTTYVIHLGGNMPTQAGHGLSFAPYGPMYGGQWATGGHLGGSHAGHPWGAMGWGWQGSNGHYGMGFPFVTA